MSVASGHHTYIWTLVRCTVIVLGLFDPEDEGTNPPKCQELLAKWHDVTSQMPWIFSNSAVGSSKIVIYMAC